MYPDIAVRDSRRAFPFLPHPPRSQIAPPGFSFWMSEADSLTDAEVRRSEARSGTQAEGPHALDWVGPGARVVHRGLFLRTKEKQACCFGSEAVVVSQKEEEVKRIKVE
jgi:hypothetical protein